MNAIERDILDLIEHHNNLAASLKSCECQPSYSFAETKAALSFTRAIQALIQTVCTSIGANWPGLVSQDLVNKLLAVIEDCEKSHLFKTDANRLRSAYLLLRKLN